MKFTVECRALQTAVGKVGHHLPGQSSGCVRPLEIKATRKTLTVTANNVACKVDAQMISAGACTVKCDLFLKLLQTYPKDATLSITVDKKGVAINDFFVGVDLYHSAKPNTQAPVLPKGPPPNRKTRAQAKRIAAHTWTLANRQTPAEDAPVEEKSEYCRWQGCRYALQADRLNGLPTFRFAADKRMYETLATDWFLKAVDLRNHLAELELGKMRRSQGEEEEARSWFAKAKAGFEEQAANGDPLGQFGLGELYAHGYGVPPDTTKADEWHRLARENIPRRDRLGTGPLPASQQPPPH